MFAAFVANSIGGNWPSAGFIGGLVATQPTLVLNFDAEKLTGLPPNPCPPRLLRADYRHSRRLSGQIFE